MQVPGPAWGANVSRCVSHTRYHATAVDVRSRYVAVVQGTRRAVHTDTTISDHRRLNDVLFACHCHTLFSEPQRVAYDQHSRTDN